MSIVSPRFSACPRDKRLTFVEDVAHGAVINDHNPAEVRLHLSQILDISPVSERAVLPVIPSCKILALCL